MNEFVGTGEMSGPGACGPYRLGRLLGSGGMGDVYLAERGDGEIEQQVAIKLLRAGDDRPAWRERFLRERQLLARLNHPAITRLLDAGHTHEGQPYLVMEYVDGVAIDIYARGKNLRDVLALFLRVCEGVSHAHQHLIIHRDLKPSNILVDAAGQPKLLDFGIARLLDETADQTPTVDRMLTPVYASPEQQSGDVQTTATDVYSLGAVLQNLVKGCAAPALRDVDFILRKALRGEPEERYASVEAFAADVQFFLDGKPVAARAGDAWYRTRRFLRRYWLPVTAAVVTLASLAIGVYVANQQRAIAQHRFLQVRRLANRVLSLDQDLRDIPGSAKVRTRVVAMSGEYLDALRTEAANDRQLAIELGKAFLLLARAQGPQDARSAESLGKAAALIAPVQDDEAAAPLLIDVAREYTKRHLYADAIRCARLVSGIPYAAAGSAYSTMAEAQRLSGDLEGALQSVERSVDMLAKAGQPIGPALLLQGMILGEEGEVNLGRPREAVDVLQKVFDMAGMDAAARMLAAKAGWKLGNILRGQQPRRALDIYDRALLRLGEIKESIDVRRLEAAILAESSYPLRRLGRAAEAAARVERALGMTRDFSIEPGSEADTVLRAHADRLAAAGQLPHAAEDYRELLRKIMAANPEPDKDLHHASRLSSLYEALAGIDRRTGHPAEADDLAARRLEIRRRWRLSEAAQSQ